MALKRIQKELLELQKNPSTKFSAGPINDNLFQWRAILFGPVGTPYENGNFHLSISIPSDYPFKPPKLRFITKIYHRCITSDGSVCSYCECNLYNNSSQWSPAITISKILQAYSSLLRDPTLICGGIGEKGPQFRNDRVAYDITAREWTQRYARDEPSQESVDDQAVRSNKSDQ